MGIEISVVIVNFGALNVTLDFAFIANVAAGAPRFMRWYGAFGLMLSLIWIYVSVPRLLALLSKDRGRFERRLLRQDPRRT